jgi:hypothetical protein
MLMFANMRATATSGIPACTARHNDHQDQGPDQVADAGDQADQGIESDGPAADWERAIHEVRQMPDPRAGDGQARIAAVKLPRNWGADGHVFYDGRVVG